MKIVKSIYLTLLVVLLASCSKEAATNDTLETNEALLVSRNAATCESPFVQIDVYYDEKLSERDVAFIRQEYLTNFAGFLFLPWNQPRDTHHDIWCVVLSEPGGDGGTVGQVLDEDPRTGTTPP